MEKKNRILFSRWGGTVSIDLSEFSSATSAFLDHFLLERLVSLGYEIDIIMPSVTTQKKVEALEKPFYSHLHIKELPVNTDDYDYIFIVQGTSNYKFGGYKGLPSQLVSFRLMRDAKCPVIYLQSDANTPIDLPTNTRGMTNIHNLYFGCSIREYFNCNFTILSVGKNMEYYKNNGYGLVYDHQMFDFWEKDFHCISMPLVRDYSLEPQLNPRETIAFVGKNRNIGSKGRTLVELGNILNDKGLDYEVDIYGNWKTFLKDNDSSKYKNTIFNEQIKGLDSVLNVYNNSKFAILANNKFNLELQQYTIRTFEVMAGGSVALMNREWFKQWRNIFQPSMWEELDSLCFDEITDIPKIIVKFEDKYGNEGRVDFIKRMRKSFLYAVDDAYVTKELIKTLTVARNNKHTRRWEPELYDIHWKDLVLQRIYDVRANSRMTKVKNDAENYVNELRRLDDLISTNPDKLKAEYENIIENHFYFQNSKIPINTLKKIFMR